jgi:hypothetical protein
MVPSIDLCKLGSELFAEVGVGISVITSSGTDLQLKTNKFIVTSTINDTFWNFGIYTFNFKNKIRLDRFII